MCFEPRSRCRHILIKIPIVRVYLFRFSHTQPQLLLLWRQVSASTISHHQALRKNVEVETQNAITVETSTLVLSTLQMYMNV